MAMRLTKDLLERRFPQYMAVYFGASWGLIEFFAFLEDRFLLSPYWTNLVLLALLLLLPSVGLFVYFHGRKGADRWNRVEKVAIPANMAVAVVVLFGTFGGRDLGAVTTTVTVEDEQGEKVERVVVKDEFRKPLVLYTPSADSTDAESAWLGYAVFNGLVNELYQDMFINLRPSLLFRNRVREAGYASDAAMPRSLKRSIAADMHVPYFVDGSVERADEGYRLTLALNDADRGRVVAERVHRGEDLFALIDSASLQLRRDLELPARHLEDSPDMPVREHTASSLEALRHYGEGLEAWFVQDDYVAARASLEAALEADPTCADVALTLYGLTAVMGDVAAARAALQTAMDNLHRLPERMHYQVKGEWYAVRQDLPRAFAVYEMWAELYPQDIMAQTSVAQVRLMQNDREGAIDALEAILDLDPTRIELLPRIGALYETVGNPVQARRTYERHVAAAPEDEASLTALAGLYRRGGDHDQAREMYERAELLEPGDISVVLSLASLDRDVGRFAEAEARYETALADAHSAEQRFAVLTALSGYYGARGAMDRQLEYTERALEEAASYAPPLVVTQFRLVSLAEYVQADRSEEALGLLDSLSAALQPPQDALVPIGKMAVYEALDRPDELEAAIREAETMLERTGMNMLEGPVIYFGGRLHEMRGKWDAAIAAYERERANDPTDYTIPAQLGRCHRELGELERAESLILETLKLRPSHGRSHYELALVYEDMGRPADAIAHLKLALETWAIADEDHDLARRAREKLAELGPAA